MADVTIYGASDDLIEIEGDVPGCDEYNDERGVFIFSGSTGAARVRIEYVDPGVWEIGIGQLDEDTPLLPMRIDSEKYSARAVVEGVDHVMREYVNA